MDEVAVIECSFRGKRAVYILPRLGIIDYDDVNARGACEGLAKHLSGNGQFYTARQRFRSSY
jgi:hypothetical protein